MRSLNLSVWAFDAAAMVVLCFGCSAACNYDLIGCSNAAIGFVAILACQVCYVEFSKNGIRR
jgi:hypothetical protein